MDCIVELPEPESDSEYDKNCHEYVYVPVLLIFSRLIQLLIGIFHICD